MDNKKEEKKETKEKVDSKTESKKKNEKIDTKSFSKVNSKENTEDLFSGMEESKKNNVKKDEKIKGTVTVDKKKVEKANKKSKAKKWITFVVVIMIIVLAVAGILYFLRTPYFAVMKSLNAMKKGDINTVSKYFDYEELMDSLVEGLDIGEEMSELEKNCFSEFTYKINKVTIEGDTVTVNVDTTNKNFRNALTKWTQKIYQKFINGEEISNEQGINLLNECLLDPSIGTMSVNKDLKLNRVDESWKIEINNDLKDAIFPGVSDVVNSIQALTNE